MSAEFSFRVDRRRGLVRIRMAGFFTRADIRAFLAAREKAHEALGCAPNQHLTLNDVRGMKIQAQDIVDAFQEMLAAPEYRSRRLAFIVSPTLAKLQLMRALDSRVARSFEDPVEAEAWLLGKETESAPRRRAFG